MKQGILNLKDHSPHRLYVSLKEWSPQGACLILQVLCFTLPARRSFRFSQTFPAISHLVSFSFVSFFFETFHIILDQIIVSDEQSFSRSCS